jgi:antirestriction protein ArdC
MNTITVKTGEKMNGPIRYIKNPDVIVKEEDEDGALAFNPDTDKIIVLNHTAHFILEQCNGLNDMQNIVQAVKDNFDDVPEKNMSSQVEEYVEKMLSSGFIGTAGEYD